MPVPVSTAVVAFVIEATVKVWFMARLAALPVWPETTTTWFATSVGAAWVMVVDVAEAATLAEMAMVRMCTCSSTSLTVMLAVAFPAPAEMATPFVSL